MSDPTEQFRTNQGMLRGFFSNRSTIQSDDNEDCSNSESSDDSDTENVNHDKITDKTGPNLVTELPNPSSEGTIKDLISGHYQASKIVLRRFVNNELWRVTQFLDESDQNNHTCIVAKFCFKHFEVAQGDQSLWWFRYWGMLKQSLNRKRNNVTQNMSKKFKGKS